MKKGITITLLLIISIFLVTGCKQKNTTTNDYKKENITVTIEDETFRLNSNYSLGNMHYKENYVDFTTDSMGNMHIIQYRKQDRFIFETRLIYDTEHSFEENKNKINSPSIIKTINDLDYTYFNYQNDNHDTIHVYMYNYNNTTYAISFVSSIDISDFETTFMNNVYFD